MSVLYGITVTFLALTVVATIHSAIFSAAANWYSRTASYWRTNPTIAARRKAAPPWFVRYFDFIDNRIGGRP